MTSAGDSMDVDPPSSTHNEPKQTSSTKAPEPEPTENLTDDELKVSHFCTYFEAFGITWKNLLFLQAKNEKELGNSAYKKKDFETALKHYNKAVELDPKNMTYYTNIAGKILLEMSCAVSQQAHAQGVGMPLHHC